MADYKTIKEYLVGLGYKIDELSQRKFDEALKRTGIAVEKFAVGAGEGFLKVGGAFVTATAAVAGATFGLMNSVAKQDLGYQIFARRMMMGTDAARKMKIATDALGYSLEEIIWGPPELAERYKTLIQDQTRMFQVMGGDTGEKAFRTIRDIGFEFTRAEPMLKIFAMTLTEDIINKLAGGPEALKSKMESFIAWFQSPAGFVKLADTISGVIVPAIKVAATEIMAFFADIKQFIGWLESKHKVSSLLGQGPVTQLLDQQATGTPPSDEQKRQVLSDLKNKYLGRDWRKVISDDAKRLGIPEGLAFAIASKESGMNPNAPVGSSGEIGMFQLMPDTIKSLQKQGLMGDPNDPEQNILGGLEWLLTRPGSTWAEKTRRYNGSGPAARQYEEDIMKRWQGVPNALPPVGTYNPSSYNSSPTHITVHVASAHATPDEIKRAVAEGINEADRRKARQMYARAQGAYV